MSIKNYIKNLRRFRVWHRFLGTSLAIFLFISAVTGVLLSLKKDVHFIQPSTIKGEVRDDLDAWLSVQQLDSIARQALSAAHPDQADNPVNRIDVRPSKGMAKVLFKKGYWEVQLDGTNGKVLSIAKRHSDWIEALHDGSIVSDWFKLTSMNILGWGLIILLCSGLWLWYGPRKVRALKKRPADSEKVSP